jgi:hypothetical protein
MTSTFLSPGVEVLDPGRILFARDNKKISLNLKLCGHFQTLMSFVQKAGKHPDYLEERELPLEVMAW